MKTKKDDLSAMYDSAGNVICCKCGNPAGSGVFGKDAYQLWCTDCSPMSNASKANRFVYKKPGSGLTLSTLQRYLKAKEVCEKTWKV